MMSTQNSEENLTLKVRELGVLKDFDSLALLTLSQDTNSETVLKILVEYKKTVKDSTDKIRAALAEGNAEVIARACHKLVGTSELLGFKAMAAKCRAIEQNLKADTNPQKEVEDIHSLLETLDRILAIL